MLKLRILLAAGAIGLLGGAAHAQIASQYQGIWMAAPPTAKQSTACKRSDWERPQDRQGLINVAPRSVSYYESRCNVTAFRAIKSSSGTERVAELTLACGGEGMVWDTRELWSIQDFASRKVLIMVQLQRSEEQEKAKQKQKATRLIADPEVSVYLQCQN